jgi:tetratricopeptide (TPR) repeat protein
MTETPSLLLADVTPENGAEFDFDRINQNLQAFISSAKENETLNICLCGDWGTGKTTLLKELEKAFKDSSKSKKGKASAPRYVTVWFEPWKLDSEREVRNALARAVLEVIENDSTFSTKLEMGIERKNVLRVLSDRLLRVRPDEINAFYKAESRTRGTFVEVEDLFRSLAEVYLRDPKQPRRMVILIDDLDRCPPPRVVKVLEAVKLFFGLPGLIFVFALDTDKIEEAVIEEYSLSPEDAKTYLEKIFQLRAPLPLKEMAKLVSYMRTNLETVGVKLGGDELLTAVVERFDRNPRRLKLFINDFNYQRHFIRIRDKRKVDDEEFFFRLYLESMVGSTFAALPEGPEGLMLGLDFIAHGGFLDDESTRDRYLKALDASEMNYVALVAYAVASKHDDVELPSTVLNADNRKMVEAIQADEAILRTVRVLRAESKLMIESDLQQITDDTHGENDNGQSGDPHSTKPEDKGTGSLRWGNPFSAQEWNILGDRLLSKAHVAEAYLCYLLAMMMEPGVAMYVADVAKPFREARQYEAARELLARAFKMDSTNAYVLGEVAFFYDVSLVEEDIGSILYRKAILYGNPNSAPRFNLAINLNKQKRFEEAFLFCLDAWARDPENDLKQDRTTRFAQDAGLSDEQVKEAIENPGRVLAAAKEAGAYPLPVTEEEERRIHEHVTARPDPETAKEQLSRPPL